MNYIIIDENENFSHVKSISKENEQLFEDGYIQIIDITDPSNPLEKYSFSNRWEKI